MNILVISDSHGKTNLVFQLLQKLHSQLDYVIHLGDCFSDIEYYTTIFTDLIFVTVTGNCDYFYQDNLSQIITIENTRIFVTHGHKYKVKTGLEQLRRAALEVNANICLFGHTHCGEVTRSGDILFFNPGSLAFPRDGCKPTYGLIDISSNGSVSVKICNLD